MHWEYFTALLAGFPVRCKKVLMHPHSDLFATSESDKWMIAHEASMQICLIYISETLSEPDDYLTFKPLGSSRTPSFKLALTEGRDKKLQKCSTIKRLNISENTCGEQVMKLEFSDTGYILSIDSAFLWTNVSIQG